ncbi:tripartite tricarboxylate transporter substrate binding protein (plasmid) [Polaromonas sp. P1-6]|nr:tripartite tricarboxylate transporter substrate binding protein [Polaromonas sp. P1-6]
MAKAPADGYTLLITVTSQLTNAGFNTKPSYNAIEDFTPIVGIAKTPLAFAVSAQLPAKNLKELAALAKNQKMAYGSYGAGTSTHVMQHLLAKQMGSKDMVHVAYRGEGPMVSDMLGGQVQMGFVSIGIAHEMEKAGKLRILAVVGPQRSEFLPAVPTFLEQGYQKLDWTYGVVLYGSSRMPADILAKLQATGQRIMADPDTQKAYRAQSNQPWTGSDPAELKKRLVIDTVLWGKVLTELGPIE